MNCPKCGAAEVLVEAVSPKTKRIMCKKCGLNEVRDQQGRPLLTEVKPVPQGRPLNG